MHWQVRSDGYRYGFQGQEMDDEIKGEGNSVNYKYRMHDPRVGRFFTVDPLAPKYPFYSPYAFSGNQVIHTVELEGLEPEAVLNEAESHTGTPYEWGGKNPHPESAGMKQRIDETPAAQEYFNQLVENVLSVRPDPNSAYEDNGYSDLGSYNIGIDCSGLASTSFNADEEKLMSDLPVGRAIDQAQKFYDAGQGENTTGILHQNFNAVGKGDLLFRVTASDESGRPTKAPHVIIATGNVHRGEDGKVTKIQIIHAPQTGDFVKTEWRSVQSLQSSNYQIGHTFRSSDIIPSNNFVDGIMSAEQKLMLNTFFNSNQQNNTTE